MSERIPARIQFGGRLAAEAIPELIALLNAKHLCTSGDENDPDPTNLHEEFYDREVSCGDLTDLEDFAIHYGLDYELWSDSGTGWYEYTRRFEPKSQRIGNVVGSRENGFFLSEDQLRHGAELLAWMKLPLPALEIVTPDGLVTSPPAAPTKPSFSVKITQVLRIQKSTVVTVEAQDEADLAAMIEEGSLDVPCADDDTFAVWSIEHSSLENETQEAM
jgi:hypothetical protein